MADPVTTIQAATDTVSAISTFLDALADAVTKILTGFASVIAASAVVAKYMPPPEQDGWLSKLHRLINTLGQNSGHAANHNSQEP